MENPPFGLALSRSPLDSPRRERAIADDRPPDDEAAPSAPPDEPHDDPDDDFVGPWTDAGDADWDVFLADDDEVDPLPDPCDFWIDQE